MYNDKLQKTRRQELRSTQTQAEDILWQRLRNRQINNLKFYRQYGVGPYILDFFCPVARMAIELDGEQHKDSVEYDKEREEFLKDKDIKTIRFWNDEIITDINRTLDLISKSAKL
jgi:very-short-patch-repair endonuclease